MIKIIIGSGTAYDLLHAAKPLSYKKYNRKHSKSKSVPAFSWPHLL